MSHDYSQAQCEHIALNQAGEIYVNVSRGTTASLKTCLKCKQCGHSVYAE